MDEVARKTVLSELLSSVDKEVDAKYKDYPAQLKDKIKDALFEKRLGENRKLLEHQLITKAQELKSYFRGSSGTTFLMESDPYHWFRLLNNLVKNSKLVTGFYRDGELYDNFMLAPAGIKVAVSLHRNLHVYLTFILFKVCSFFDRSLELMSFAFFMPVLITALVLIAAFFFTVSISPNKNILSGFFAVLTLGLANVFLRRSMAGWFDTDPYVVLFSSLAPWMFYLSLNYEIRFRKRAIFSSLGGLIIALFSFTWDGWWYIFYLILGAAVFYILNLYFVNKDSDKKVDVSRAAWSSLIFIISSFVLVCAISGISRLKELFSSPLSQIYAKDYSLGQFWPNTFLTVAELKTFDILQVIAVSGGSFVVICGLIYLFLNMTDKKSRDWAQRQYISWLFTFWVAFFLFVSTKVVRMSLILVIPVSISFALFMGELSSYLRKITDRILKKGSKHTAVFVSLATGVVFLGFLFNSAFKISFRYGPDMNRVWFEVLKRIDKEVPQDSIINSWWDYGHWFKAIAGRPVIFDGATQNNQIAYWMARALITDNEEEAFGILRMLNSGSSKAFEEIESLGYDKFKTFKIINEIILLNKDEARKALAKYTSDSAKINKILSYTHNPRPAYIIIEPSIIRKIKAISFLGSWDFNKARLYSLFSRLKKQEFAALLKAEGYAYQQIYGMYDAFSAMDAKDFMLWVSRVSDYYDYAPYQEGDNPELFSGGFLVSRAGKSGYIFNIRTLGWQKPKYIYIFQGQDFKQIAKPDDQGRASFLLFDKDGKNKLLVLDDNLVKSMLTRLYYLDGRGLKHFEPFIKEELKDGELIVYKINWDN